MQNGKSFVSTPDTDRGVVHTVQNDGIAHNKGLCNEENTAVKNAIKIPAFDMLIDWFEFTIKGQTKENVLKRLFGIDESDDLTYTPSGVNGYNNTVTIGNKIHIMWHDLNYSMGIHVLMSGSACREFEQMYEWPQFMQSISEFGKDMFNINRVDIAIDCYNGLYTVKSVQNKFDKGEVCSKTRSYEVNYSSKISNCERLSETVTVGSKSSLLYIVFYNKLQERRNGGYEMEKDLDSWVRCETRFKGEVARALFDMMLNDFNQTGKYVKGILYDYLDFKVVNTRDSNKSRWETCRWWTTFLNNANRLRIGRQAVTSSIVKKRNYADMNLSKIITLLHMADANFLPLLLDKGMDKLKPRDMDILNAFLLDNNMQIMKFDDIMKKVVEFKNSQSNI